MTKNLIKTTDVNIGDLFVGDCGYNCSRPIGFQVIEKKGDYTLVLKRLSQVIVEGDWMNYECKFEPNNFYKFDDEIITRKLKSYGSSIFVSESDYCNLYKENWDKQFFGNCD